MDQNSFIRDIFNKKEDDLFLRPQSLAEFIGQENIRQNLRIFIEAAQKRNEPLDHILLYGPPGLGKTTLAQIVAKERGVNIKTTSGPAVAKSGDLAAILTNLQPFDVLFIDEIHRLQVQIEEILYSAMEDFKLDIIIGEGPSARSIRIDLPPFTLVGATTRSGLLTQPLRERFGIPLHLNFYSIEELALIIKRASYVLKSDIDEKGSLTLAQRSRGTPRIASRLLRRVRDFATIQDQIIITSEIVKNALHCLDIDSSGLDQMDIRYLKSIADFYNGGPVGVETLSAVLSEQKDTIEDMIEPYLVQQGFIKRTPRGRILTDLGYNHLGIQQPNIKF